MPKLVANYNNTVHSSIKMKPNDVRKQDVIHIARLLYPRSQTKPFKFEIGDLVRISKAKKAFRKGYLPNWSTEIFKVVSRFRRVNPVYEIEDLMRSLLKRQCQMIFKLKNLSAKRKNTMVGLNI